MRNILMTVMLLMVVALLYTSIVTNEDGIKDQIQSQGDSAIDSLRSLTAGE